MKITDALKNAIGDIRVTYGNRWLYWDEEADMWTVREHTYGQRGTSLVCASIEEDLAVQVLLED